jgi:DNA-binding response OmpR family regulator
MAMSSSRSTFLGRVLVIDDEPETVDLLRHILSDAGFDVVCALNGGDGLMLENFERPDIVLLDLTMPGVSGLDVLCRVRIARPDVPVIIVSGQDDLKLARATLECGAVNYIRKPFDPDHLIDAVAAALTSRAAPRGQNNDAPPRRLPSNLPRNADS